MTSREQPRCTTGVVVISARRPSMRSLGGAANEPNATRLLGPTSEKRNRSRLGPAILPSHDVSETGTSDEASRSGSKNHPGLARGMTSLSPISAAASWPRRSRSLFHGHHTFHMPFRNQQALETVSAPHVPHGPGRVCFSLPGQSTRARPPRRWRAAMAHLETASARVRTSGRGEQGSPSIRGPPRGGTLVGRPRWPHGDAG